MFPEEDMLRMFYGKKAALLLDGRSHEVHCNSSLEAIAQISKSENQSGSSEFLAVDSIEYLWRDQHSYGHGLIRKKYIMGIFEEKEEDEE